MDLFANAAEWTATKHPADLRGALSARDGTGLGDGVGETDSRS